MNRLIQHEWLGNVRELKSIMDYMLTICENQFITENDIPTNRLHLSTNLEKADSSLGDSILEKEEYLFILKTIKECNDTGKSASREWISHKSKESNHYLTTQQIRKRLDFLELNGLIIKGNGRAGTKITVKGANYL